MDVHFPEGMNFRPNRSNRKRKHRLHLQDGDLTIRINEMWDGGFTIPLDAELPQHGFVDLFDGPRHLAHALIMQTGMDAEERHFEFKIVRDATLGAPRDFSEDGQAPVAAIGFLGRSPNTA